jgi:hypothetical protein
MTHRSFGRRQNSSIETPFCARVWTFFHGEGLRWELNWIVSVLEDSRRTVLGTRRFAEPSEEEISVSSLTGREIQLSNRRNGNAEEHESSVLRTIIRLHEDERRPFRS